MPTINEPNVSWISHTSTTVPSSSVDQSISGGSVYLDKAPSWVPALNNHMTINDAFNQYVVPPPPPSDFNGYPVYLASHKGSKAFDIDWLEEYGRRITGLPLCPVPDGKLYAVLGFPNRVSVDHFPECKAVVIPDVRILEDYKLYSSFQTLFLNVYFTMMQWYEVPKTLLCAVTEYPFA